MSTLEGRFLLSPREREKEREEIAEEMKKKDRGERKMNESEEMKNISSLPLLAALIAGLAQL